MTEPPTKRMRMTDDCPQPTTVADLPVELLTSIFSFLDVISIVECNQVCFAFYQASCFEHLWSVHLAQSYFDDLSHDDLPRDVLSLDILSNNYATKQILSPLIRCSYAIVHDNVDRDDVIWSKWGGIPYTSDIYPWPVCECGYKRTLIMQLDRSDVPRDTAAYKMARREETDDGVLNHINLIQVFGCCSERMTDEQRNALGNMQWCSRFNHVVRELELVVPAERLSSTGAKPTLPDDAFVLPTKLVLEYSPQLELPKCYEMTNQIVDFWNLKRQMYSEPTSVKEFLQDKLKPYENYLSGPLTEIKSIILKYFGKLEEHKEKFLEELMAWDDYTQSVQENIEAPSSSKLGGYEPWCQPFVHRSECSTCSQMPTVLVVLDSSQDYWFGKNQGFGCVYQCKCPNLSFFWQH